MLRIATWNVNSLRARNDRFFAFLERQKPDVVCLQELKMTDDLFPFAKLKDAGYDAAAFGQKTYNGVAIVSKRPMSDVTTGFLDGDEDPQARFIAATVDGVRVMSAYFPNGSEVGSEKYDYKLRWMKRMRTYLDTHAKTHERVLLCGDFNVAAEEIDVHSVDAWKDTTMFHESMRSALTEVRDYGFVDVFRKLRPEEQAFSWWDYRGGSFPRNHGIRIDYIYATPAMNDVLKDSFIDREERKGPQPSDHAPVLADFEI
jgi:exodeoxyribonuclease-3